MNQSVTLLNFDDTYRAQSFLQREKYEWLDLKGIQNTNLFCEKESLLKIAHKLNERKCSDITFIGSGNFHYASYLLQLKIKQPYTLVLFDNHTDMFPSPDQNLITCGSWVIEALQRLPMLKKVIIIGVNENWHQQTPSFDKSRATIFTTDTLPVDQNVILNEIPTENVYIGIDKDVLDPKYATTAWDHGTMSLSQLMEMVNLIAKEKEVIGLDVCGEYPNRPDHQLSKEMKEAVQKNERANRFILENLKIEKREIQLV